MFIGWIYRNRILSNFAEKSFLFSVTPISFLSYTVRQVLDQFIRCPSLSLDLAYSCSQHHSPVVSTTAFLASVPEASVRLLLLLQIFISVAITCLTKSLHSSYCGSSEVISPGSSQSWFLQLSNHSLSRGKVCLLRLFLHFHFREEQEGETKKD